MSSEGLLTVGNIVVSELRDGIQNELLAVFRDEWLIKRTATVGEWDPDHRWTDEDPDEPMTVYEFRASGVAVAQRLDVLGNTPEAVNAALEYDLHGDGRYRHAVAASDDGELAEYWRAEDAALDALTPQDWLKRLQSANELPEFRASHPPVGSASWLYSQLYDMWPPYGLRATLMAFPNLEVRLDITQLVEDNLRDDETPETVASQALQVLRYQTSAHSPIVVLTEGKTDAEFLQATVDILYPHLNDVLRFLDYTERPEGGAGALARTVRAFAAAGIANRVVAMFDNDTAATDALRPLARGSLPSNIAVMQYPPLPRLESYPTLGPPTAQHPAGTLVNANVNGLAGSIELYLGVDSLIGPDGAMQAVQWKSFIEPVGAYQGEVTEKAAIQEVFRAKVRACRADPAQIPLTDWSGLKAIVDGILLGTPLRDSPLI